MSESDIGGDLPPLDPELQAWLSADTPGPMPDDVWTDLQARLAAEPALVPPGLVDLATERSRRRPGKALPLLAGAAGLVLVGAVVLPSMQTSSPAPVADGASSAQPALAAPPSPQASDEGAVASAPASTSSAPAAVGPAPAPRAMISTGTDYAAETLPAQVTALLSTAGMSDRAAVNAVLTASPPVTSMPGDGLASSVEALTDCLGRLGLPPESMPLMLDRATVDGREGSVIVTVGAMDAAGQPTSLHVVAVGQDCTDEDAAAAQHLDLPLP
jgi:hypothetical protein